MHDSSMIINGSTQKVSKVHNRSTKVHILSTKTVQCLLPSCRVATNRASRMQIKFIWICWGDADWRRSTCGDRALQNCYSGKYYVFAGIRRPLSVTKNSKNSQLSQNSRLSTISTISQLSRLSTISTISKKIHPSHPSPKNFKFYCFSLFDSHKSI